MAPAIVVDDMTKHYGNVVAVDHISFQINEGEIFGFLGPNGAGKTTTIRMMAGLMKPTSGRILLDGKDVFRKPEEAKAILGYIPDRPYLYEKLTGGEFLEFIAGLHHLEQEDGWEKRSQGLLEYFDLLPWRRELIESYSHGMRQRLIITAALLHRPKVLVADEPVVGLDPRGVRLVKSLFRDLVNDGMALFLSTHILGIAEDLCPRIGIIHEGQLVALGSMSEIREQAQCRDERLEPLFLKLTQEEDLRTQSFGAP
jgi:ABC-2 type transport system ATP-binding protein